MSQIQWNSVGNRRYEVGIDRGVLYTDAGAVPWNGLTSIDEISDTTVDPLYFNGVKYYDYVSRGDYKGTLKAFTYPAEFELFDGVKKIGNGIYITGQIPTGVFHLSYRTQVGNDLDGADGGYKIHVLYNLTAKPSNKSYATIKPQTSAFEFSWDITSVPVDASDLRPTSHIVFDTTEMHESAIYEVERILYGTDTTDPGLLTPDLFETITSTAPDIIITDNGDGTWTANGSDYYIKQNGFGEFAILEADAVYLDPDSYEIGYDIP